MRLEIISEKPASASRPVPLLFVHGMWFSAWCWAENFLPYFARHGYEAYALSLRGHGDSEGVRNINRVSLKDYLRDVLDVAGQFSSPPVLVGHSMGGLITQMCFAHFRPAAAVLLASVPPGGILPATWRIIRRQPLVSLKVNLMMDMQPLVSTPSLLRELTLSEHVPQEALESYFARAGNDSYRAFLGMLAPNLKIKGDPGVPLLVLGAENDMIMSENDVRNTARRYGVEAEIFSGMAHCMMLETGWQKVADRIIGWLENQGI
jgi:pimeloyl-ACP methyl ester carboxylesterase